jgi:hypothetical protein
MEDPPCVVCGSNLGGNDDLILHLESLLSENEALKHQLFLKLQSHASNVPDVMIESAEIIIQKMRQQLLAKDEDIPKMREQLLAKDAKIAELCHLQEQLYDEQLLHDEQLLAKDQTIADLCHLQETVQDANSLALTLKAALASKAHIHLESNHSPTLEPFHSGGDLTNPQHHKDATKPHFHEAFHTSNFPFASTTTDVPSSRSGTLTRGDMQLINQSLGQQIGPVAGYLPKLNVRGTQLLESQP